MLSVIIACMSDVNIREGYFSAAFLVTLMIKETSITISTFFDCSANSILNIMHAVPISVIASFKKMKKLTRDHSLIVAAMKESSVLVIILFPTFCLHKLHWDYIFEV